MADQDNAHLAQKNLAEIEDIDGILAELRAFLAGAKFGPGWNKNMEKCVDGDLPTYAVPLLRKICFSLVSTESSMILTSPF